MNKKIRVGTLCLLATLCFGGCGNSKAPQKDDLFVVMSESTKNDMEGLTPANIKQFDGNVLSKRITFDNMAIMSCINENKDSVRENTISICGKYLAKDDIELLSQRVRELVTEVTLYSKDEIIVSSDELEWNFQEVPKGIDFTVTMKISNDIELKEPVKITRLSCKTEEMDLSKECECFYLMPYNDSGENMSVVRGPGIQKGKIFRNTKIKFSYYVASDLEVNDNSIKAELIIPKDCKEYCEIKDINVKRDDKKLEELRNDENVSQVNLQLDNIHVYKVTAMCLVKKGFRIGFEPLIQLTIDSKNHIIAPPSVLDLHIN